MKVLSKFCRFSIVLLLALTVAFSAAVGVSAAINIRILGLDYLATNTKLYNMSSTSSSNRTNANPFVLEINDNFQSNTVYSYVIELSGQSNYFRQFSQISDIFISEDQLEYLYPSSGQNIINYSISNYYKSGNTNNILLITIDTNSVDFNGNGYLYLKLGTNPDTATVSNSIVNIVNYANYQSSSDEIKSSIIISDKLDNVNNNINESINNATDEIVSSIENIDTDSIIQILNQIYSYGNNYNQIDQTIINNLGSAEDQLSSAEGALENKSQSLKDSVASQWSNIQSTSKTFITNLAPTAAAVGSVTTQFMDAAPEEVKGLFVTIPLIIFIGWLIGRIRGD